MAVDLAHLRCLVAVAETGTFTDAAIDLGVSQAAVSRSVAALESELGVELIRRGPRQSTPTPVGHMIVGQARRVLAEAARLVELATAGHATLRVGYAWAAVGKHTVALQRRWAQEHPGTDLRLMRLPTPTAGLAEGQCDAAITRVPVDGARFASEVVGLERRLAAFASDGPLAKRRSLRMAEISEHTVLIDERTGTTSADLWPAGRQPATIAASGDVDEWLNVIAAGTAIGTTSEATASQYPRPGVSFRPIADGPRIPVRVAWHKQNPHPAVGSLVELLTTLYHQPA